MSVQLMVALLLFKIKKTDRKKRNFNDQFGYFDLEKSMLFGFLCWTDNTQSPVAGHSRFLRQTYDVAQSKSTVSKYTVSDRLGSLNKYHSREIHGDSVQKSWKHCAATERNLSDRKLA